MAYCTTANGSRLVAERKARRAMLDRTRAVLTNRGFSWAFIEGITLRPRFRVGYDPQDSRAQENCLLEKLP